MVDGLEAVFPAQIELTPSRRGVMTTARAAGRRVGVVTGGGSGHEPAFFGYVGPGYADGAALGNVFASPSATPIVEVAERVERGVGVLFVYGNYEGDVMNFEMADELLGEGGIRAMHLAVADDVADELLGLVLTELQPGGGVRALVNTLGATPLMEALVVVRRVASRLRGLGVALERAHVGEYVTSLEMAGLSLTLVAMDDDLRRLLDAPAHALAAPPLQAPW